MTEKKELIENLEEVEGGADALGAGRRHQAVCEKCGHTEDDLNRYLGKPCPNCGTIMVKGPSIID